MTAARSLVWRRISLHAPGGSRTLSRQSRLRAPTRPAALHELAPVPGLCFDAVLPGLGCDPPPGRVTIGVADVLHLVESRDGISNVVGVIYRALSLLGKRELWARRAPFVVRALPGCFTGGLLSMLLGSHSDTSLWP